ncbi:mitochondrial inner-membrane-bound regulator-domain-containing protein [Hypoxylon sp. FL0890]|nr:mitochondrial inner-membrane-bound regulator-domain-containing protein [Hypoxylon sp. FL0890]
MIAPSVSSSAICLRCQLRLIRQSSQPLQAPSCIFALQHPSLRRFASDSPARAFGQDHVAEEQDHTPDSEKRVQYGNTDKNYPVKRMDVPKRRLSRNRILTEDTRNLESDMLGKPASVIVMKDEGLYKKRVRRLAAESRDEPNSEQIDIEALLDSQREPPNPQEVRENIDGLRPKTETALSERKFRKLQALLTDGFLSAQLQDYLEHHKQDDLPSGSNWKNPRSSNEKDLASRYEWIREISPWMPLACQSGVADGIDPSLRGYVTDSTTIKQKLAIRIMRECWGLSIAELDAGLGETRVKIGNHEFVLLMRGTQRWMTVMGKIWLEPGEKIEAFRNQKTLRLVTTKPKAAILIEDLDQTLKQIKTESFPMSLVTSKPIDEAVLEEVGRITNTHTMGTDSRQLRVTWIELKKRALQGLIGLENLCDIVFRLLLTAYKPQPATTTTLYATDQDGWPTGRFVTDAIDKKKLGWKDRMGQWARYSLPLTLGGADSVAENPLERLKLPVERQTVSSKLDENNEHVPETQLPLRSVKWAEDLKVSTKATFGYILHANEPSALPPPLPDLLTANHPRVFASITPHPLHLAELKASDDKATNSVISTNTTIVIRFWPSPPRKIVRNDTPPLLELRLATSGGKVEGVESLRAIKQIHITDVMLPGSLVDLRYTQAQYAELKGAPARLATWQPLANFLEPARLDLEHGKLEVPPRQRFPIPRRLFNYTGDSDRDITANPDLLMNKIDMIDYTFTSLEIHRSVSMPYEGFNITYTSIDGQRGGSYRAEVSLEPGIGSGVSADKEDTDKLHSDFLVTCQKFARTDSLWSGYLATRRGS